LVSALASSDLSISHIEAFVVALKITFNISPLISNLWWGSVQLLLMVCLPTTDLMREVARLLQELDLALPQLNEFFDHLDASHSGAKRFDTLIIKLYTQIVCFCARSIRFFRLIWILGILLRHSRLEFSNQQERSLEILQRLSKEIEQERDAIQLKIGKVDEEVLSMMMTRQLLESPGTVKLPCFHAPFTINERFYKRENIISQIEAYLNPKTSSTQLKSLSLFGLRGVGKTQIALQYTYQCRHLFDAVIWIPADTHLTMSQNFLAVGQHLSLTPKDTRVRDPAGVMTTVKAWLSDTPCRWLLVFDNADDLDIFKYGWPGGVMGSILITPRDFAAGHTFASTGIHINTFNDEDGSKAILSMTRLPKNNANKLMAKEMNAILGGLSLALNQMSGFILSRKLSLQQFLPLYKRNKDDIDGRKTAATGAGDYNHTLGTVWEVSLSKLSGEAAKLQRLLAFLQPDEINEAFLVSGAQVLADTDDSHALAFVAREMSLLDAEQILMQAALVEKSEISLCLSVHRLV
ncbi:uncharacterized protein LY89DRAFT_595560, partial [Mollisia scopiformis]